jgi:FemAB-related protein (PEP-CTERM system-associated)
MAEQRLECDLVTPAGGETSRPEVRPLEPGAAERWDEFVFQHPQASFFHLLGWKWVIEKTFGFEPHYVCCERGGTITGIAPLFLVSNWLVGRCLISVPFAAYGGICATDSESQQALIDYAKNLAVSERVGYLELRHRAGEILDGFHPNKRYVTFTAPLSPDPEALRKRLPKDTRYMIRKAEKGGLRVRAGMDQLDQFYCLVAQSLKRLGTPAFPLALFRNIVEQFPKHTHLSLIHKDSRPVAGVLSFFFRDAILPYYSGASQEAPRLAANDFMYWELMKWAGLQGFRWFDFGRSKTGTGAFAFKSQWSMQVEPLNYQVFLVRRKTVPNFSPVNPKFELATRVWKQLPLSLATSLGPRVVRWFP